eukprot:CAMPEP_0184393098 /NCGR_PEP_ID=MMETSP0007-20130409/31970_1 /TAXON_ID=97485 /ORGANISM="Prymnesium parvum, Strain Texoma1" /LENGTH=41 /DNA_ID= /DNA_START= /DNA_END= /DNA_ORIENTATION=
MRPPAAKNTQIPLGVAVLVLIVDVVDAPSVGALAPLGEDCP